MKSGRLKIIIWVLILIGTAAGLGWMVLSQLQDRTMNRSGAKISRPVPVKVAQIQHGSIKMQRTFSGELESLAEFVVAPKVSGRVERMIVNIADTVNRGQVVVEMDNHEYVQAVAQAKADLAVARAKMTEAKSALEIADREFKRTESLSNRGITAASDLDAASQNQLARQAQLEVAAALVKHAESSLEIANIKLGYTKVTAGWTGSSKHRVVAERYVDEGQTVAANAPLLLIVELNPIIGVIFVTERDYVRLKPGQLVMLTMDAYPDEQVTGKIERVAPVFHKSTRQARIEIIIDNPRHKLKPGMFIRATVVLDQVPEAIIVPEQALALRNDRSGVFVVSEDGRSASWQEVKVGFREGKRVQVEGQGLTGRVVTLGQQLVKDGSRITIPAEHHNKVIDRQKVQTQ